MGFVRLNNTVEGRKSKRCKRPNNPFQAMRLHFSSFWTKAHGAIYRTCELPDFINMDAYETYTLFNKKNFAHTKRAFSPFFY